MRNTTDNMGKGRKNKIKTEREANHKRLLNTENKQDCWRGVGWGWTEWVMGIKEGTFWDEHWVSYVRGESLDSTPEAKTTLCIN